MYIRTELKMSDIEGDFEPTRSHAYGFESWEEAWQALGCLGLAAVEYRETEDDTINLFGTKYTQRDADFLRQGLQLRSERASTGVTGRETGDYGLVGEKRSKMLVDVLKANHDKGIMLGVTSGRLPQSYASNVADSLVLTRAIEDGTKISEDAANRMQSKAAYKSSRLWLPGSVVQHNRTEYVSADEPLTIQATVASSLIS